MGIPSSSARPPRFLASFVASLLGVLLATSSARAAGPSPIPGLPEPPAPPEEPGAPDEVVHLGATDVRAPVTVRDARGVPVAGLRQEDFKVYVEGKPQEIVGFESAKDLPLSVAVVLDASSSVRDQFAQEKDAVASFLRTGTRPSDRASFWTFSGYYGVRRHVELGPAAAVGARLSGVTVDQTPGSPLFQTVVEACTDLGAQGGPGIQALFLVSDGADLSSKQSLGDAIEACRSRGILIFGVSANPKPGRHVPEDKPTAQLRQLAEQTGGEVIFPEARAQGVTDLRPLADALKRARTALSARSILYFSPTDPVAGEGSERRIEVRVPSRPGAKVSARPSFRQDIDTGQESPATPTPRPASASVSAPIAVSAPTVSAGRCGPSADPGTRCAEETAAGASRIAAKIGGCPTEGELALAEAERSLAEIPDPGPVREIEVRGLKLTGTPLEKELAAAVIGEKGWPEPARRLCAGKDVACALTQAIAAASPALEGSQAREAALRVLAAGKRTAGAPDQPGIVIAFPREGREGKDEQPWSLREIRLIDEMTADLPPAARGLSGPTRFSRARDGTVDPVYPDAQAVSNTKRGERSTLFYAGTFKPLEPRSSQFLVAHEWAHHLIDRSRVAKGLRDAVAQRPPYVSEYAGQDRDENFAENFALRLYSPEALRHYRPDDRAGLDRELFRGVESSPAPRRPWPELDALATRETTNALAVACLERAARFSAATLEGLFLKYPEDHTFLRLLLDPGCMAGPVLEGVTARLRESAGSCVDRPEARVAEHLFTRAREPLAKALLRLEAVLQGCRGGCDRQARLRDEWAASPSLTALGTTGRDAVARILRAME